MTTLALVILGVAIVAAVSWFAARLRATIKADGYGFRAASGLRRDWAPSDLPRTPYSTKAHY